MGVAALDLLRSAFWRFHGSEHAAFNKDLEEVAGRLQLFDPSDHFFDAVWSRNSADPEVSVVERVVAATIG